MHRPSLPPMRILVLIFRGWFDPTAHGSVGSYGKNSPATPLGIDSATLRLAAQSLHHYATPNWMVPDKNPQPHHNNARCGSVMTWAPVKGLELLYTAQIIKLSSLVQPCFTCSRFNSTVLLSGYYNVFRKRNDPLRIWWHQQTKHRNLQASCAVVFEINLQLYRRASSCSSQNLREHCLTFKLFK
jgi:hypothetical protein